MVVNIMLNRFLASLVEYIELKRDIGDIDDSFILKDASSRLQKSLNDLLKEQFEIIYQKYNTNYHTRATQQDMTAQKNAIYSWNDIEKMLSALYSAPIPPENITDLQYMEIWMTDYKKWFDDKNKIK